MSQKLDSFVGYAGRCVSCGRLGWVPETTAYNTVLNVLYTDGQRSGWATGPATGVDPYPELLCTWPDCEAEHGPPNEPKRARMRRPLETLEEQEIFQAAYKLGGIAAVATLFHARGWR